MESWPAPGVPQLPARPAGSYPLRLYSSAAAGLVSVEPTGGLARLYVCGITPYDATHLGHAATYLAFDTLHRYWQDAGLDVLYVQNVTDIDDPLLERAARDGLDWTFIAERDTQLFRDDMTSLRVIPPKHFVGAVEAMAEIADLVVTLRDGGWAYEVDGDLYFPISGAAHFGQVSGLTPDQMLGLFAERGGDPGRPGKKDALDALLWRRARPGEPSWDSPLGRGRPGWHVECAAIALNRLGSPLDVQGGGSDLVFPHHEHSATEAAAATGTWPFARAYVHAGMVGWGGHKMSKSRGNLVFVSRLLADGVDPRALRLALLAEHYRHDRDWTTAMLDTGQVRLLRWASGVARPAGPPAEPVLSTVRAALADDLDTPAALASIDAWCAEDGTAITAPGLVRDLADALLGVDL